MITIFRLGTQFLFYFLTFNLLLITDIAFVVIACGELKRLGEELARAGERAKERKKNAHIESK